MCINPKTGFTQKIFRIAYDPQFFTNYRNSKMAMRVTSKALLNLSIIMQMQIRKNPKVRKSKKIPKKTSVAKQKPKTDGSYLGGIRCGAIDHFPRDCKSISHKCTNCISPAIQKLNA